MISTPARGCAASCKAYDADDISGECELWLAVIAQAAEDLLNPAERIRANAVAFFEGPYLLRVLDMAGIGRDFAPAVRKQVRATCQQTKRLRQPQPITFEGQTHPIEVLAKITALRSKRFICA